jgi:hypothetical protein
MGTSCSLIVIRRSTFDEVGGPRHGKPANWHFNNFCLFL